ncbi:MAG: reverse transcriptase domain-containing protein [Geminicoccaceae bacterium]
MWFSEERSRPAKEFKSSNLRSDPNLPVPLCTLSEEQKRLCDQYRIQESSLTPAQKLALLHLLQKHNSVFAKDSNDMGECNIEKHFIDTGDARPIACNPHRLPYHLRGVLREELDSLLRGGIIEASDSPWAAPCLYVPKKDGTWRLCVDFRKLNEVVRPCVYPLPRIEDIFDTLEGHKYFTAIDLAKGFWQICLDEQSKHKAAFTTIYGQYQYRRLPFGLATSPGAFQKVMNTVLAGLNWVQCMVYLDDILVFSPTFDEQLSALDKVFSRLAEANLKIKLSKCEWARTELNYLGHVINSMGKAPDPRKAEAIKLLSAPNCVKDIESFLGKVGYYHKFIKDFSKLAYPLNRLKRKGVQWRWGPEEQEAFEQLRDQLCEAPVLRHPDFTRKMILQTDASGYGLGVVLTQIFDDGEQPIAYASRTLEDRETRHAIVEKEALAIAWGIHHFRHYLIGREFLVLTDHRPLESLSKIKDQNTRLQKISLKLQGYRYKIQYRPGKKNQNADLLSRYPIVPIPSKQEKPVPPQVLSMWADLIPILQNQGSVAALQTHPLEPRPPIYPPGQTPPCRLSGTTMPEQALAAMGTWDHLHQYQAEDQYFGPIKEYLEEGTLPPQVNQRKRVQQAAAQFALDDGVLWKATDGKLQVCIPPPLQHSVIYQYHATPQAAHLGLKKTYAKIIARYYWPGMYEQIATYVKSCPICKQTKPPSVGPKESLGHRSVPTEVWQTVHIDLWTPGGTSPTTRGNTCVLAVVDELSKFVVARVLPAHTRQIIIDALVNDIFAQFGLPHKIVSDRGPEFTSQLFVTVFDTAGVTRELTAPGNPKANGQVERFFRPLRTMLSSLSIYDPKDWDLYVSHAIFAYNSSFHRSAKNTPFFLMYGRDPDMDSHTGIAAYPIPDGVEPEHRVRRWRVARKVAIQAIEISKRENEDYYDRNIRPQYFALGDVVLLARPPPTRTALPRKLLPPFVGPYRIIDIKGKEAKLRPLAVINFRRHQALRETSAHFDRLRLCDESRFLAEVPPELRAMPDSWVDPNLEDSDGE